jgi:hypothetical protein
VKSVSKQKKIPLLVNQIRGNHPLPKFFRMAQRGKPAGSAPKLESPMRLLAYVG